jgi:hypothetical protein
MCLFCVVVQRVGIAETLSPQLQRMLQNKLLPGSSNKKFNPTATSAVATATAKQAPQGAPHTGQHQPKHSSHRNPSQQQPVPTDLSDVEYSRARDQDKGARKSRKAAWSASEALHSQLGCEVLERGRERLPESLSTCQSITAAVAAEVGAGPGHQAVAGGGASDMGKEEDLARPLKVARKDVQARSNPVCEGPGKSIRARSQELYEATQVRLSRCSSCFNSELQATVLWQIQTGSRPLHCSIGPALKSERALQAGTTAIVTLAGVSP